MKKFSPENAEATGGATSRVYAYSYMRPEFCIDGLEFNLVGVLDAPQYIVCGSHESPYNKGAGYPTRVRR